jgi:transcription elongation GreA/GreB family factor
MNGNLNTLGRTPSTSPYADVDPIVTSYHLHQARTKRRRENARGSAPRRAIARRTAFDAALQAAGAIADGEERIAELARLEERARASSKMAEKAASVDFRREVTLAFH